MIDWSQAQFWIQLCVYIGIIIGTAVYVFIRKRQGKDTPPALIKLLTGQQEVVIKWFWKAMEDGVITLDEAKTLKDLVGQGFEAALQMIISLYGLKPEEIPSIEAVIEPIPEPTPEVVEN